MEKLSTGEEVACTTLMTVDQVIGKWLQNHQIWEFNDGVMLCHIYMKLKWIHVMKALTPGINNDIGITINSAGKM